MMTDNMLTLTSCKYSDLAKHSKVINPCELDYFLWVYLNPEAVRDAYFNYACELSDDPVPTFPDTFRRASTSWIQIRSDHLNKEIGLHIYKFCFIDRYTGDEFSLYMNYIIQREDQDKPYIYMHSNNDNTQ